MNINLMLSGLGGDIAALAQAVAQGEGGVEGQEFEDMLLKQSEAAQAQRREEKPKEKPEKETQDKQETEEPQDNTVKEQPTENGYQVAASIVTAQPMLPVDLVTVPELQYTEDGAVILEGTDLQVPNLTGETQGVWVEGMPQNVDAQPEAAPEFVAVTQEVVAESGTQNQAVIEETSQVKVQQELAPETAEPVEGKVKTGTELPVQKTQEDSRPEDQAEYVDVSAEGHPVFRRDTVPIKVAENYTVLTPEAEDAPQQLAGAITEALDLGANTVLMELNPANLGQLSIHLSRNAAGELAIVMIPQTDKAANILTQHSSALMNALMDKGEQIVTVEVRMPQDNQNANMFLNPDGHNQRQPGESEDERKRRKNSVRTESVNATDFLQQLRLGLVELEQAQ